jgi:anti-anti-sigma factor
MEIKTREEKGVKIIELKGNLDGATAENAREEIFKYLTQNCRLVIDLKNCSYISSAGLRVLMVIAKKITASGGKGVLTGISEDIKEVMEMTGFDHIFQSYDSISQAITAVLK